jgi:APA family basic amino acid/polyamine antiporter
MKEEIQLKRAISLPLLVFYGVGTIVGGGIYALLGEVVGSAGLFTPISLFIATLIALFSALSYAELSSRYPFSAGEAHYVKEAFSSMWLSHMVGWLVIFTGIVSTATLILAITKFLADFVVFPHTAMILFLLLFMGLIAIKGIKESVWFATFITVVEVGGLLFIVYLLKDTILLSSMEFSQLIPPLELSIWQGVLAGAFIIFYAFIGFEDMVNVAQEVKDAKRVLPKAIVLSIAITFLLYMLIALGVVLGTDLESFANAKAPLASIAKEHSYSAYVAIWSIGILAGVNGALIQTIMASRVLYGISSSTKRLHLFSKVHHTTRTPIYATLFVMALVLVLALGFDLVVLAKLTSTIVLILFTLVNLALITIKRRGETYGGFTLPLWLPLVGLITSMGMLGLHLINQFF